MKKHRQKFHHGDLVHVSDDLGKWMNHFLSGCDAIVIGSYSDQYSGDDVDSYTLHIKNEGRISWYHSDQLKLIAHGQAKLLEKWETGDEK